MTLRNHLKLNYTSMMHDRQRWLFFRIELSDTPKHNFVSIFLLPQYDDWEEGLYVLKGLFYEWRLS